MSNVKLLHILNSSHPGVKCPRAEAGDSSALSEQVNLWPGKTFFALLPLLLKGQA